MQFVAVKSKTVMIRLTLEGFTQPAPVRPGIRNWAITWYIEMHHVEDFFSVWCHDFLVLRDVHSQRVYHNKQTST